ncbi:hypothetical protein ACWEVP_31740 [Amycolatopsis sp. NPDC003865]
MPDLILKDAVASIEPGDDDTDSPNGTFDVILSAPVKDRDGETVKPDEWEPLPDHITFDIDHGMSVASTVGSGKPTLDKDGNLRVSGTYASTQLAQDTRALVKEGHIRTTSVAFLRKSDKDSKGNTVVRRELLNGAFVAIPANPAALVLSSKAATLKIGARNNAKDKGAIQAIHDHAESLGASCSGSGKSDDGKSLRRKAAVELSDELRAELAKLDPDTLPEPVRQALTELGLLDPDEESSAAEDDADESAAEQAADDSATESAADLAAAALAVRASRLRVISALTTTED